jgi:hypothetical protein
VVNKPVWGKQYHTDKCLIADSNAKHGWTWSNRPRFTTLRSSHGTEYVRHSDVPMGAKFNNMLYATIDGTRSYSGEIYQDINNDVIMIDQVETEEVDFENIKTELNKEMRFCSFRVLTRYFEL